MAVKDLFHDIKTEVALEAQTIGANTDTDGADITHADFQSVTFVGQVGNYTDGDYEVIVQDASDDGTGSPDTWSAADDSDVLGSEPTVSTANWFKVGYRGIEPHVRLRITSTNVTTGATVSALAVLSHARSAPFTATT